MCNLTHPDDSQNQRFEEEMAAPGACIISVPGAGDPCPSCQVGQLDYDGMLNLACPKCGVVVNTGGTFT